MKKIIKYQRKYDKNLFMEEQYDYSKSIPWFYR